MKYKNLLIIAVLIVFIGCTTTGSQQVADVHQSADSQPIDNQIDTGQTATDDEQKKEGVNYYNKADMLMVGQFLLDVIADIVFFHSMGW